MCDDITEKENEIYLSRRNATAAVGAAFASALVGCKSGASSKSVASKPPASTASSAIATAAEPPTVKMETAGKRVVVDMPEGKAEAFFVAPTQGAHPGVVLWPDIAGLRTAYETMATRLASAGYAVLAVNQYYRSSSLPVLSGIAEWRTEAGRAKVAPMRAALTDQAVSSDGKAFAEWLDAQPQVDKRRKLGSAGYCMGGPFTFRTAAAAPDRVGAIASFHGGGLVKADAGSPHRLIEKINAALLICIAQNDDTREPEAKNQLRAAAEAAGRPAEIKVYAAQHGWCTIDAPVYNKPEAELAWSRMLQTFERYL